MNTKQQQKLGALIAVTVALTMTGCGQDFALSPQTSTRHAIQLPEGERPSRGLTTSSLPSVTSMVSAANGGTLTMGRYTLTFPAGALNQDTAITMSQKDENTMTVELQPHGIHFNVPVTLTARVGDLVDEGTKAVGVAWVNDASGEWDVVGENSDSQMAVGHLWHFSSYVVYEE